MPIRERKDKQGKLIYLTSYLMKMLSLPFTMVSATISCAAEVVGTNQSPKNGDKLILETYLDRQQTTFCPHGLCSQKQLAVIKSRIKAKFTSNTFLLTVQLNNGNTVSVTTMFCSFGIGK